MLRPGWSSPELPAEVPTVGVASSGRGTGTSQCSVPSQTEFLSSPNAAENHSPPPSPSRCSGAALLRDVAAVLPASQARPVVLWAGFPSLRGATGLPSGGFCHLPGPAQLQRSPARPPPWRVLLGAACCPQIISSDAAQNGPWRPSWRQPSLPDTWHLPSAFVFSFQTSKARLVQFPKGNVFRPR